MTHTATDLVGLFQRRGQLLARLVEAPTDVPTLTKELSVSRSTVRRALATFDEWDLITPGEARFEPTLFARLVLTVYDDFAADVAMAQTPDGTPRWRTVSEQATALKLLADWSDLLEYAHTPRDKRTLVAALPPARSTIDRAVRELEQAALIERTAAGYQTTAIGKRATTRYRTLLDTLTDVLAARELLDRLPADCPFAPALLAEAEIERADDTRPYRPLAGVRRRFELADRVRAVVPAVPNPQLLDCWQQLVAHGTALEFITTPPLFETLTSEFPGLLTEMADATERFGAYTADIPPFGLVLADTETGPAVSIIVYVEGQAVHGAIHTETTAAAEWAEVFYEHLHDQATETTSDLQTAAPAPIRAPDRHAAPAASDWLTLETEGFVQLTPEYFTQRAPAPPVTVWRTGFDLVDVHAGYAIDRETASDSTRHNLTSDLTTRLTDSTNLAILGAPGSGKSTICKTVACRWYEQGLGPVFYRESGTGAAFSSPPLLEATLRATTGHALVVIEDAVRAEANAIFRVMQAFRGTDTVTFLLDAREAEWTDLDAFPIDAGLEAFRNEAVAPVAVPPLDDVEIERFITHFGQTTADDVSSALPRHLRGRGEAAAESHSSLQASPGETPGELLLLLHRLALYADPLEMYDARSPTTFIEDVQRSYENLRQISDYALDAGILVNLLNATGLSVTPGLVYALVAAETEPPIDEICNALAAMEGRIIFERDETARGNSVSYRTVHEAWSAQFLTYLLDAESERAAEQRFGRCVTALLSLADDEDRRDWIVAEVVGETPVIERIAAAPDEWAETTVERLFRLGRTYRALGTLFGTTDNSLIDLPDACSLAVTVDCTLWRAEIAKEAGALDRAEQEFEAVSGFAREIAATDPEWAATLRGRRLQGLGRVAWLRGELDTGEEYLTRTLTCFREAGNTWYHTRTRLNLGTIADSRGNLERAEAQHRQGLETARKHGYVSLEADALFYLGLVIGMKDELEAAIEFFRQSLALRRESGDRRGAAYCLILLGNALTYHGDLATGDDYCKQALETVRELGTRKLEAHSLSVLGLISRMRGDLDTAETYCQRALAIRQDIGAKDSEAYALVDLGEIATARGRFDVAEKHCTTSREICRKTGNKATEASCLAVLGTIARKHDDLDTATEHIQASFTLRRDTRYTADAATSRRLLGQIACDREEFSTAEDHFTQALSTFRDMGFRYEEAETLAALGRLAQAQTDGETARKWFEAAVELYREIGAVRDTIETTEQLAAVCATLGERTIAREHCETAHTLAQETDFIDVAMSLDERRAHLMADHASENASSDTDP